MPYDAETEPREIVPDLRTMPNAGASGEARATLGQFQPERKRSGFCFISNFISLRSLRDSSLADIALDRLANGYAAMTPSGCLHGTGRDDGRHEGWL